MSVCLFNEPIYFFYAYVPQREHVIDISFPHKWFFVLSIKISVSTAAIISIFAANYLPLSMLGSSVWWFALFMQTLTRFKSSSRFPFNFNPLHFNHRFNWSTVYSSESLSNFDPGTLSSSIRTVKDCCALLAIRKIFPYFSYRVGLCLSESRRGLKFRDVINARRE